MKTKKWPLSLLTYSSLVSYQEYFSGNCGDPARLTWFEKYMNIEEMRTDPHQLFF